MDPAPAPNPLLPALIATYLARFAARSPDTRHRYFREVRCFCTWLRAAGYTANDPFRGLRNVRLPRKNRAAAGARRDRPPDRLLRCGNGHGPPRSRDPPHPAGHRRPLRRGGRTGPRGLRPGGAAPARPPRQGRQGPHRALRRPLCRRPRRLLRRPGDGAGSALRRRPLRPPPRRRPPPAERAQATAAPTRPGRRHPARSRPPLPATRSPPGPSRTTRANSMYSTSSGTVRRR